jgi:excisionase family DNA binding protein
MPMLSIADVCEEFGLGPSAVRALIKTGQLRAYKVGGSIRIKPDDLSKALRPIKPKASV